MEMYMMCFAYDDDKLKFKRLLLQIITMTNELSTKHKCQRNKRVIFKRGKCFRKKGSCLKVLWGVMVVECISVSKVFLPNFSAIPLSKNTTTF